MRIATDAYSSTMIAQFNALSGQARQLQNEVSTGLSIQQPSDNATAMQSTLNDLSSVAAEQQYGGNISTLQSRADLVYSSLQSLQTLVSQAGNIATSAGSGTAGTSELNNYANQVQQLIQQAVQVLNTKDPSTGQYLFAGTNASTPPYTTTTDASGNITGVTYGGNSQVNQTEVAPGITVAVDVPGENTSGTGAYGLVTDSRNGSDLFNHLIALQNDLSSGNTSAVSSTDIPDIQKDENNVTYQVANNGNVQARLSAANSFVSSQTTDLDGKVSNESGADMVQVMTQLSQTQTAYQAALQSSALIMQLSILNFIQ
jgi:flagellar hook-associated protein 3 FlgL